jgi:hypothetical protein
MKRQLRYLGIWLVLAAAMILSAIGPVLADGVIGGG